MCACGSGWTGSGPSIVVASLLETLVHFGAAPRALILAIVGSARLGSIVSDVVAKDPWYTMTIHRMRRKGRTKSRGRRRCLTLLVVKDVGGVEKMEGLLKNRSQDEIGNNRLLCVPGPVIQNVGCSVGTVVIG